MGSATGGKRDNQKLKPYITLQILQRETDENHVLSAKEIAAALELCCFEAEHRSIYRDIEGIIIVNWFLENEGSTIQEAKEALAADKYDSQNIVVYDTVRTICTEYLLTFLFDK